MKLVLNAADALAAAKGALDERFPRQRDYVSAFFLDVAPERLRLPRPSLGRCAEEVEAGLSDTNDGFEYGKARRNATTSRTTV